MKANALFLIFVMVFGMWFAYAGGKATQRLHDLQIIAQVIAHQQDVFCNAEVENR